MLSKIEPGKTRTRAELLNEKSGATLILSQHDFKQENQAKESFNFCLISILKMLDECIFIWSREDSMSQEGVMIKAAAKTKEKISRIINNIG